MTYENLIVEKTEHIYKYLHKFLDGYRLKKITFEFVFGGFNKNYTDISFINKSSYFAYPFYFAYA